MIEAYFRRERHPFYQALLIENHILWKIGNMIR